MSRRLVSLTLDSLDELARVDADCHACVFWQLGPAEPVRELTAEARIEAKQLWVSETLREWGSCGQLLLVDGEPAGHALYAPPAYVPRAESFATSPAAGDAVLLYMVRVRADLIGGGLGRMLLQGVARDVVRRGVRALEAFGRSDLVPAVAPAGVGCLPPVGYLRSVGFKTVRAHPTTPRLRMELRSVATWREDVEHALERLLGSVPSPARR